MFTPSFPYSAEEAVRLLAAELSPADKDLILMTLNRKNTEKALVDGCSWLQIREGGASLDPLDCLTVEDEEEPPPEDEEDDEPDKAPFVDRRLRGRNSRPYTNIYLPKKLQSARFQYPMIIEVNRSFDGVTVSAGDGGDADIIYINSGSTPVKVDGEKLMPYAHIRVRSPKHLEDQASISGPEQKRLARSEGEKIDFMLLSYPVEHMAACSAALARFLDHAGMENAQEVAKEDVYHDGGYGEIQRLIEAIDKKIRLSKFSLRLSEYDLVRFRISLAAGLYGIRVAYYFELPGWNNEESRRVLLEYLKDEKKGGVLLTLLERYNL